MANVGRVPYCRVRGRVLRGRIVRKLGYTVVVGVLCLVGMGVRPAVARAPVAPIRVYIFAGQSNMVGAATMAAQLPTVAPHLVGPKNLVSFFGPTTDAPRSWGPLQAPTEVWKNMFHEGFGPELSAGRALSELHPRQRIGVVKFAWNATSLAWDWDPNRSHSKYETMIDGTRLAIRKLAAKYHAPVRVSGFFWLQGESDADTSEHASSYGANLREFIAAVRADFAAPKLPFVIAQIDDVRKYHPVLLPHSRVVRAQQARVAREDPRTFLVRTDGLGHNPVSPIHFSSEGTVDLGGRFVQRRFGL
jgi:hypothetical protein